MDAPVLGAFDSLTGGERRWQVSFGWRSQVSDRHFRGTHEEPNRQEEGSEVVNELNLLDIGIRYNFNRQTSLSLGIPYLTANRSHPIRNSERAVVGRSPLHTEGVGDITLVARHLLWDPAEERRGNLSLGLGIKFPTGEEGQVDDRARLNDDGLMIRTVETVDQSVQPGDGGWGIVLDMSAYRELGGTGTWAAYASGAYLLNPRETNGVRTFRSRESEAIMSVADQYLFRTGVMVSPRSWRGFGVGLGGRIEGIPVHDLVGGSDGFRRPGYAISVEPTLTWTRGLDSVTVSVPVAVQRNRQRSVTDRIDGRHGDAAFADYVFLLGYWRRF